MTVATTEMTAPTIKVEWNPAFSASIDGRPMFSIVWSGGRL
ncbi:MAG TPA: hypothetical protein VFS97_13300 [Nitrososphaeraceae archaeon]|nr:hypothetical protein [Nitrososphaeraceae archaeon]